MTTGFLSSYAAFSAKTVNEIRQERAFESQPPAIIVSVLRSSEIYTQFYLLFRAYYEGREKRNLCAQADSAELCPIGRKREPRKHGYDELLTVL
jgi:hypothetical protein